MPEYGPFRGLHRRDNKELIPLHYLEEAENIDFRGRMATLRPRFSLRGETTLSIKKIFDFSRTDVSDDVSSNLLGLVNTVDLGFGGTLRDLTRNVNLVTGLNIDFSAVSYLHRAFILTKSESDKENLHYYDGEDYREAGLDFDASTLDLDITSVNSGNIFEGNYHVGYVLETDTGYFSVPYGLSDYVSSSNSGSLIKIVGTSRSLTITADFDDLPSYVTKVHFISTSSIPNDSINYPADSFTYYFIPEGTLERSSGDFPGSKEVNYFPPQLFANISHLEKQHEVIKGGDGLAIYNNRLCIWGGSDLSDQSILRVSRVNEPESFSRTDGFIVVAPEVNSPIVGAFEFRGDLYIIKGNSTYLTRDNGSSPATWPVVVIDKGLGSYPGGISSILSSQGTSLDFVGVATQAGLMIFNGVYQRPELSWNVEDIWAQPKAIVRDPREKKIYILIGNDIYVCNYVEGVKRDRLRWSKWTFSFDIEHMIIDSDGKLNLASEDGVYRIDDSASENVSAVLKTGALAGGAHGAMHFGDVLTNKIDGPMTIEVIGRQSGSQGTRDLENGNGVYRSLYAFTDDSAQVKITASEDFELGTINVMTERLWQVPING